MSNPYFTFQGVVFNMNENEMMSAYDFMRFKFNDLKMKDVQGKFQAFLKMKEAKKAIIQIQVHQGLGKRPFVFQKSGDVAVHRALAVVLAYWCSPALEVAMLSAMVGRFKEASSSSCSPPPDSDDDDDDDEDDDDDDDDDGEDASATKRKLSELEREKRESEEWVILLDGENKRLKTALSKMRAREAMQREGIVKAAEEQAEQHVAELNKLREELEEAKAQKEQVERKLTRMTEAISAAINKVVPVMDRLDSELSAVFTK
jgi:hypothetical protein